VLFEIPVPDRKRANAAPTGGQSVVFPEPAKPKPSMQKWSTIRLKTTIRIMAASALISSLSGLTT
jgi:hypothetical protein